MWRSYESRGKPARPSDRSGHEVTDSSAGEFVINVPNLVRAALGCGQETAQVLIDGWSQTCGVGRFDGDGYLITVDWIRDLIIRCGKNLYPKEIENVLRGHTNASETAAVGAPFHVLGGVPGAYVTRAKIDERALRAT